MMPIRRIGAAVAAAAVIVTGLTSCSGTTSYRSAVDKANKTHKLVIGIKYDQPGLGLKQPDGAVSGLDVDVATFIAGQLGVPAKNITWVETRSANREPFLQQGQVDLVVASYSITDERKKKVTFAGP